MKRPTIADLANAAEVSVSTVNRILNGKGKVRASTVELVLRTAEEIGFYGLGALRDRSQEARPRCRFGFLLQQSHRELYRTIGQSITDAARRRGDVIIEPVVQFVDDLRPELIAEYLLHLGADVDAIAVIAADHPLISQTVSTLANESTPVFSYITDLSAPDRAGYVGADSWKVGRTAAWFISNMACRPGKILSFIGNHRYQCQDVADASFRSYIREHAPDMTVSEAQLTHEEPNHAYDMVRDLLQKDEGIVGLFIGGGGISGVLRAMRELPAERQRDFKVVCREIGPETRIGLTEGLITAALSMPMDRSADELISVMADAVTAGSGASIVQRSIAFDIITPESI